MDKRSRHLLMSVSKSVTSAVCGRLVDGGLLRPDEPVTLSLPELAGTSWDGCTVRHLLDMRAGTRFNEDYTNLDADVRVYEQIYLWRPRTSVDLPTDITAYYATLANERPHGGRFDYRSILTDVLAWVMERAKRQLPNYVALPTETFADQLMVDDPLTPVQALYLGRANTRGDAIVWLPKQKVMISGDAVVAPTPYGFSDLMQPWLATLDRMEKYDFKILIPGHGRVQRDRSYLATLRWSMGDIKRQAEALAKSSATPEQAAKKFDRMEQQRRFGANDAWTKRWLDGYWLDGMFEVAFKQARGLPVESGTDGGE